MKILAMYLPQYHRVKENDEWWGMGYTDWVSTRKAIPYFEGHNEPRIPKDENYYDLLLKRTMEWQADLMGRYGIDGMCIYHYWFKDGRQILEKPAENLLLWKDINMPYCFCWANETWARSWANIPGANCWYDNEKAKTKNGRAILLEQKYGDFSDWKKHFEYLLPFYNDERYIKFDNKPIFVLYKPEEISCLAQMLEYWNALAKNHGFNGIYTIGANLNNGINSGLDAELFHQPGHTIQFLLQQTIDDVKVADYDKIWEYILSEQVSSGQNVIFGGFVDYDDTPRRGRGGLSVLGADPIKFQKYLSKLIDKNVKNGNELVFINAWNEWGEGMYLEPDQKNQEAFLIAVKKAREDTDMCLNAADLRYTDEVNKIKSLYKDKNKIENYFDTLDKWLTIKEQGKCLEQYFKRNNIKNIGIYGYGVLGKRLVEELYKSDIIIECIIDKNISAIDYDIKLIKPESLKQNLDVIVVTAYYFWYEIVETIHRQNNYQIISLKTIIDEVAGYEKNEHGNVF